MFSRYDYADLVLPVLLQCEEMKDLIHPYYRKNGPCGTVISHGDKWMGEDSLVQLGIPEYKQVVLYLLFRCSELDAIVEKHRHETQMQFIEEWFQKLKQYLPDLENTAVEIEKVNANTLKTRFSFDRIHWSEWRNHEGLSKSFYKEMLRPDYWMIRIYRDCVATRIYPELIIHD